MSTPLLTFIYSPNILAMLSLFAVKIETVAGRSFDHLT